MRRSTLTAILALISMLLIFVSFFFTSQLPPLAAAGVIAFGIFFFPSTLFGTFLAYTEKHTDVCSGVKNLPQSCRSFFFFNILLLLGTFVLFFTPVGLFIPLFEGEGIPPPINTQNLIFIFLWVTSTILLILATALYEDQVTKRWI
ncbi:MAG: hypothetical protein ACFFDI_05925 [Promethearchaeota archaeon]